MPTARKVAQLNELKAEFQRAQVVISANYRGLNVARMSQLRRALREAGVDVKVVKNRIAGMAADEAQRPELREIISGPTAIAVGFDDPVAPAKAFTKYVEESRLPIEVHGAWIDGQILDGKGLAEFSKIPSREELIAQIAGKFQSPLQTFAGLLQATVRDFTGLVESRAGQLEEQGSAESA